MVQVELRRLVRGASADQIVGALNALTDVALGNGSSQLTLYGFDGNRRQTVGSGGTAAGSVTASGQYALDVHSAHASGLAAAFPLTATARTAARSPANCAVLIRNAGLAVGAGLALTLYASGGSNNVSLSSDGAGGLVLGGTGSGAGTVSGAPDFSGAVTFSGLTYADFASAVTISQPAGIARTVTVAHYRIIGKLCHLQIKVNPTGAGTAGNAITLGAIPAAIAPVNTGVGQGQGTFHMFRTGGLAYRVGSAYFASATTIAGIADGDTAPLGAVGGGNFALANGDTVTVDMVYELL